MRTAVLTLGVMAFGLQACGDAANAPDTEPLSRSATSHEMPDYFASWSYDLLLAEVLAAECPALAVDRRQVDEGFEVAGQRMVAEGYTKRDLRAMKQHFDRRGVVEKAEGLLKTKGVVPGEPQTFCEAGSREMAENTRIGSLLRAK